MLSRRNWLLRTSIILNVVVLCYVGSHIVSYNAAGNMEWSAVEDGNGGSAGRSLAGLTNLEYNTDLQSMAPQVTDIVATNKSEEIVEESVVMSIPLKTVSTTQNAFNSQNANANSTATTSSPAPPPSTPASATTSTFDPIQCYDREQKSRTGQRGDFWVLYNFVRPSRTFRCGESVTYTTHADYTFLDNLEPLLERWKGPISLALHAPGTDFEPTLQSIQYLRECGSPLVSNLVTFHIFFGNKHVPKAIPHHGLPSVSVNCSLPAPWVGVSASSLYKAQKKILYPVNVGRNVARESATTHYILPSDIELYPSPGVISDFLEMIRRRDPPLLHITPKVFPLSIFELEADAVLPDNKTRLVEMLKSGKAIPFHKKVCPGCHNVPRSKEWLLANETEGLHVFHIGKRSGYFVHWEPIFIGTHDDPLYDERLSWEGKSDKMTQGYALCVLDYEFQILDNAFLVHKPGIKVMKKDSARAQLAAKTNALIKREILPQLKLLYGERKGCAV